MTNQTCALCNLSYNALNGRYCKLLNRYVEFDKQPKCNNQ